MSLRAMSVAGSFYPSDPNAIEGMIERFNAVLDEFPENKWRLSMFVTHALIVPHAGWIYSGFTANMAYRVLAGSPIETAVLIGPSHRVGFRGISICTADFYETPSGTLAIDQQTVSMLQKQFDLIDYPAAHHEHSTEVQVPFIRHYFPDIKIVELVYGEIDPAAIEPIISFLLRSQKYGVIISTDLSHFYPLEEANQIDEVCLNAIDKMDPQILREGCEACGIIGVEAMILSAAKADLESVVLDYRTSADTSGDDTRVVGYTSAIFQEKI